MKRKSLQLVPRSGGLMACGARGAAPRAGPARQPLGATPRPGTAAPRRPGPAMRLRCPARSRPPPALR